MVPQCNMPICIRNTQQMAPQINTIVSDFIYIASGNSLDVNMSYVN